MKRFINIGKNNVRGGPDFDGPGIERRNHLFPRSWPPFPHLSLSPSHSLSLSLILVVPYSLSVTSLTVAFHLFFFPIFSFFSWSFFQYTFLCSKFHFFHLSSSFTYAISHVLLHPIPPFFSFPVLSLPLLWYPILNSYLAYCPSSPHSSSYSSSALTHPLPLFISTYTLLH